MQRTDQSIDAPHFSRTRVIRRSPAFCAFAAFLIAVTFGVSATFAAEDWSAFLDALKSRGYDDVAHVYLKQLQESGQAPPELDAELDYRVGAAAFDEAIATTGTRRTQLLGEANAAFEKYLGSNPDGTFALEANAGQARIAAERGDSLMSEARRNGVAESSRDEKLALARVEYAAAKKSFAAAIKLSQARVKSAQGEGARVEELRAAQAVFLDLTIRYATTLAQIARTYPEGSDEYKKGLTDAGERFGKIYSTYQRYAGAYKARLSEAQIDHELGDDDAALEILSEIGVLPLQEEFYALKTRALELFAEIVDKRDDPTRLMELVQKFLEWSDGQKLPDVYYQSAEGRRIYLLVGKALIRLEKLRRNDFPSYAAAGKKAFVDTDDAGYKELNVGQQKKSTKLVVFALKTLSSVGSGRSEEAVQAQEALKDEIFEGVDLSKYSFTQKADDFDAAADIATRAAANFSEKRMNFQTAADDVKGEAEAELKSAARDALRAFRTAIDLSARAVRPDRRAKLQEETREATLAEVNKLLLKHAVVAFAVERYEEAFVAGDAVAHADDFDDAPQGAIVALRSLQTLLAKAKAAGSPEVETLDGRVRDYVAFANAKWGDDESSPIAQESLVAQLEAAAAAGDVQEAVDALGKIPEDSPRRASAELKLGRALWAEWARRNASGPASIADDDETEEEAVDQDALLELARKTLYDGLERKITSDEGVSDDDANAIYCAYLLAQAYAQQGDNANAEKWLTHPRVGALAVVNRSDSSEESAAVPAFVDDNFRISVLALELRLVASDAARIDEARQLMSRLDALVADSDDSSDSAAKLTRVYLSLGKRFEERLESLKKQADGGDESKRAELEAATKGFETFLNSVADRDEGNSYASLRWIAESYLTIGKGLLDKKGLLTAEAAPYFAKARDLCRKLIENIKADPDYAPSEEATTATLLKVCEIMRYEGKYQTAYKNLLSVLAKSPNNVDAQWEAASLLEAWGRVDPQYYTKAIAGDAPSAPGKNLVWGWNGIVRRLAPSIEKNESYKTLYYDACKAKARTRYKYVESVKDPEEKKKQAQAAEDDVRRLYQTHPGFNGPETVKYFDAAYRGFQKLRGVATPTGLKDSGSKRATEEGKS